MTRTNRDQQTSVPPPMCPHGFIYFGSRNESDTIREHVFVRLSKKLAQMLFRLIAGAGSLLIALRKVRQKICGL